MTYTPTTDDVRNVYADFSEFHEQQFNLWLNKVKAEVWYRAYIEGFGDGSNGYFSERNPYRTDN